MNTAADWIKALDLTPHPEGGYFSRSYTCAKQINGRPASTSIYFLLAGEQKSRFHRLDADELWYYHTGSSLLIHCIDPEGAYSVRRLGVGSSSCETGDRPQQLIPAQTVFAAELADTSSFALVGCMVSPGFKDDGFTLFTSQELIDLHPRHERLIRDFT